MGEVIEYLKYTCIIFSTYTGNNGCSFNLAMTSDEFRSWPILINAQTWLHRWFSVIYVAFSFRMEESLELKELDEHHCTMHGVRIKQWASDTVARYCHFVQNFWHMSSLENLVRAGVAIILVSLLSLAKQEV